MPDIHIYQIYYSKETRAAIDKGFIGLDNMSNERPDWREYWPIRRHLLNEPLVAGDFYGFFSPRFNAKTGLDSAVVFDFIRRNKDTTDVFLFSPFFDQSAFYLNIFEQGCEQHKDMMPTFRDCAAMIAPETTLEALVTDSTNTVFCNYFVARPDFWAEWLKSCELVFNVAESGQGDLAKRLNSETSHRRTDAPAKVFVIERIASLLLSTRRCWRTKSYDPMSLPWLRAPVAGFRLEMALLDALKIAHVSAGHPQYMDAIHRIRDAVSQHVLRKKA
jgi:hypothetical protein